MEVAPRRRRWRRLTPVIAGVGCTLVGLAIGLLVEIESDGTFVQRLAPLIAGFSLGLAIFAIGAHLSRWGWPLSTVAAVGWALGMFAVAAWILEDWSLCGFAPTFAEPTPRGLPSPKCGQNPAQVRAQLAGLFGFGAIIAASLLAWLLRRAKILRARRRLSLEPS